MAGLTDEQLKAAIDNEMRHSVGYFGGKLANRRQRNLYYYEAIPKGELAPPEVDGRSTVVSPEVRNVIESMLPELVAKFASSERVVELDPSKEGEEEMAQNATEYINHVFYKQNDGTKIIQTWFKDALISCLGVIKVYWDTRTEELREEYKGLDQFELAEIMDDEEVTVIEQKSYPDEEDAEQRQQAIEQITQQLQMAMQAAQQGDQRAMMDAQQMQAQIEQINATPPAMLFDIAVKRVKGKGKIRIENVPPEEFMISRKAKSIKDSPFVGHRVVRTASELKSMGYKNVDQISSDDTTSQWLTSERVERVTWDDEMPYLNTDTPSIDESQRLIWVTECYIRADRNGDGISELLKVTKAGNELLDIEEVEAAPFVDIVPIVMPHRFFGLCPADLAIESQRVKTSILRAMLDGLYLDVNGRYFAVEGQVNLDDLLTSRPGGVVRIKQPGAVGRLDQGMGDKAAAMEMLNYMQGFTEEATGWQRVANAVDNPDSLNATATAANIQANRASMRVDLIARNFAEGMVELFKHLLRLICQHQNEGQEVYSSGRWLKVDPREWRNQFGFTINVGLGTGDKSQQVQKLMAQLQVQQQGLAIGITNPENIYQTAKELSNALGFKNSDRFWTDPAKNPPPPMPNPEMEKVQAQLQADAQKFQAQAQLEREKAQIEIQTKIAEQEAQARERQRELELEAQRNQMQAEHQAQIEALKAQQQAQLEQMRLEMEWRKAQLQAETQIIVASMTKKESESPEEASEGAEEPNTNAVLAQAMQGFAAALERLNQPRQIVRGPDGRVAGVM